MGFAQDKRDICEHDSRPSARVDIIDPERGDNAKPYTSHDVGDADVFQLYPRRGLAETARAL